MWWREILRWLLPLSDENTSDGPKQAKSFCWSGWKSKGIIAGINQRPQLRSPADVPTQMEPQKSRSRKTFRRGSQRVAALRTTSPSASNPNVWNKLAEGIRLSFGDGRRLEYGGWEIGSQNYQRYFFAQHSFTRLCDFLAFLFSDSLKLELAILIDWFWNFLLAWSTVGLFRPFFTDLIHPWKF